MAKGHPAYRPDIDGLRAIAVLCVVIFHADFKLRNGFTGVDIFFVISGYLISSIIFTGCDNGSFTFRGFYARRIRRIFPALAATLFAVLAAGWFLLFADEYALLGTHTAAGAACLSNILLWQESGYFDTAAKLKPLLHLWSLGVEEQFYLLWPLLVVLFWRARRAVFWLTAGIVALSFLANLLTVNTQASAAFFLPHTRFWQLLAGGLLAYADLYGTPRLSRIRSFLPTNIQAWAGIGFIVLGLTVIPKQALYPGWWGALPVLGAFLLIAAGPAAWPNRILLSNRVMVFIGLISYPLYLWHWPLLSFVNILESQAPSAAWRFAAVLASFLLAWLTYRFLERPIRTRTLWPNRGVPILLALLIGAGGLGGVVMLQGGFPQRIETTGMGADTFAKEPEHADAGCRERYPFATDYCRLSTPSQTPSVLLLGDSHAASLYDGIRAYYTQRGQSVLFVGWGGCPPVKGIESVNRGSPPACFNAMQKVFSWLEKTPEINTVVLAMRGALYVNGNGFGKIDKQDRLISDPANPARTEASDILSTALGTTLSHLKGMHKRVVLIHQVPELGFDPRACDDSRPLRLTEAKTPCAVERAAVDARQENYRKLVAEVLQNHGEVTLFDPVKALCNETQCMAREGTQIFYRDDNHLNRYGAEWLSQQFRF